MSTKLLVFIFLLFSAPVFSAAGTAVEHRYNDITTLVLHGTQEQMGVEYGKALKHELHQELTILENFYIHKNGISYVKLEAQAELFYQRFPFSYQQFLYGESKGSGLNLDEVKILNAMETFGELLPGQSARCAFISIPENKTKTHALLIGRNYDFPAPFDQLSKYLTVTVMHEDNTVPTAFVSIAGEIYCPTCMNAKGLFMELNNGMPSGGSQVEQDRQSLLINMLEIMQNSDDLSQMEKQLRAMQSDYSLIVNTANKEKTESYEFSSSLGMKTVSPQINNVFVSTNFYLNHAWQHLPTPTDTSTWLGITRRNNLLHLANQSNQFDVQNFEALMDKNIQAGGGEWKLTIYQLIYDTNDLDLYIKLNKQQTNWIKIPLKELFN